MCLCACVRVRVRVWYVCVFVIVAAAAAGGDVCRPWWLFSDRCGRPQLAPPPPHGTYWAGHREYSSPAPGRRVAVYGGSFSPITVGHVEVASELVNSRIADEVLDRRECVFGLHSSSQGDDPCVMQVWIVPCGPRPDKPSLTVSSFLRCLHCVLAVEGSFPADFPVYVVPAEVSLPRALPSYATRATVAGDCAWVVLRCAVLFSPVRDEPPCCRRCGPARYELMSLLKASFPELTFVLVVGSDLLPSLSSWVNAPELLEEVEFVVVPRPGFPIPGHTARHRGPVDAAKSPDAPTPVSTPVPGPPVPITMPRSFRVLEYRDTSVPVLSTAVSSTEVRHRLEQEHLERGTLAERGGCSLIEGLVTVRRSRPLGVVPSSGVVSVVLCRRVCVASLRVCCGCVGWRGVIEGSREQHPKAGTVRLLTVWEVTGVHKVAASWKGGLSCSRCRI